MFFLSAVEIREGKTLTEYQVADLQQYKPHGWAKQLSVRNQTPYDLIFYSDPLELTDQVSDGMIVQILSTKTGFGNYYRVKKDDKGMWRLYADTRDRKDPATQFFVSMVGKGVTLLSETADGLFLESDPKTFDVVLNSNKATDNAIWDLVEDPKAGPTLDICFLQNRGTKGFLTASYDEAGGSIEAEMANLRNQIKAAEDKTPYLTIVDARVGGLFNSTKLSKGDLGRDVTAKFREYVKGDTLEISGKTWVQDITGVSLKKTKNSTTALMVFGGLVAAPLLPIALPAVVAAVGVGTGIILGSTSKIAKEVVKEDAKKLKPINIVTFKDVGRMVLVKYKEGTDPDEKQFLYFESKTGKDNTPLKLVADINKHPATALKKRLEELEKKVAGRQKLKISDVGRTGFEGAPFSEITQWSKVSIKKVVDIAELDDRGAPRDTIPGGSARDLFVWAHRRPEFKGFGSQRLEGFGPEVVVTAEKMFSKGFMWLEQGLKVPGRGTVAFRTMAEEGDVQICFSDSVAPYSVYRIAFGAAGNSKAIIYKNDVPVQEVTREQNPDVRMTPGMIEAIWVSINLDEGFIFAGKSDPGANIVIAWKDPSPAKNIDRIGFSSHKTRVKYTDVRKIDDPIIILAPEVFYFEDTKSVPVGPVDNEAWYPLPLSPADAGTLVFEGKASDKDGELVLTLANEADQEGYDFTFSGTEFSISRVDTDTDLFTIDLTKIPSAALSDKKFIKYWVSVYKGQITVGSGDIAKNTFCIFVDKEAPSGLSKIGFSGKAAVQKFEIWPEVELGFPKDISEYSKARQYSDFKGALSSILPVHVRISQDGPMVRFKDVLTGDDRIMAGTPEPDAEYNFRLDIEATGEPKETLLFQDVSAEKMTLQKKILMADAQTEASFRTGQIMAYAAGPNLAASIIAMAAAGAANVSGSIWSAEAAKTKGALAEFQEQASRLIPTERFEVASKVGAEITGEAQKNRQLIETKLEGLLQLGADLASLEYATKQWDDVFRLITDFYTVDDAAVKQKISDGLKELYNAVKTLDLTGSTISIYNRMVNIFIKAYTNPYITKDGDPADEQRKRDWYAWLNSGIAAKLFSSPSVMQDGLAINFKGDYLWFPVAFAQAGRGSVSFEAKGYDNVFVGFAENPYEVRNSPNRMYEIIFGMFGKMTVIHRKNLGDSVIEFSHKKYPDLAPDPVAFKKYWINMDNGVISCGVGTLGQNKVWEWKDPYPFSPVKWVGFGNWLGEVVFKNIKVGYPYIPGSVGWESTTDVAVTAVPEVATEVETSVPEEEDLLFDFQDYALDEPVVEEPVVEQPGVKAAKKPAAKKPAAKKPAKKKTAKKPAKKKTTKKAATKKK
jgi:hypothetical protein